MEYEQACSTSIQSYRTTSRAEGSAISYRFKVAIISMCLLGSDHPAGIRSIRRLYASLMGSEPYLGIWKQRYCSFLRNLNRQPYALASLSIGHFTAQLGSGLNHLCVSQLSSSHWQSCLSFYDQSIFQGGSSHPLASFSQ